MKKIHIFLISAILGLSSCSDSFMELTPSDKIMGENFYKTKADIQQALVAAYDPLTWDNWSFGQYSPLVIIGDVMSDDIRVGGSGVTDMANWHEMRAFKVKATATPMNLWTICYSGINRAHLVIENMPKVQKIDESSKQRILAEANVLKAYYYFQLWRIWGNIPHYDVNLTAPYTAPQLTADEVYTHIISYLDYAIEGNKLPEKVSAGESGRITSDMAKMLKAKAVLYQNDNTRYAQSLGDMKTIISSKRYELFSDFEKIFMDAGEWCSESIWEIIRVDDSNSNWDNPISGQGTVLPMLIGINGLSGSAKYGEGWGFSPVEPSLYELYSAGDQRRDGTILSWAKLKEAEPGAKYSPRYDDTGYFNKKYTHRKGYDSGATSNPALNFRNNDRIFRYSETLLNASELILRTGGSATEAQEYFDTVRKRALGSSFIEQTVSLDNVLNERHLEFALEGHRFWDLVRYGKAEAVLGARGYTANKKHLPIPQSEIDKTNGALQQNPY